MAMVVLDDAVFDRLGAAEVEIENDEADAEVVA